MSDPSPSPSGAPDLEAEELAAKQNISIEDARRVIAEAGHDRAAKDGAAGEMKAHDED